MTLHLQKVSGQALVASFLGFGSPWPLLQRMLMPLELFLRPGCVCNKPCDISVLFVSLRITGCPLEAAFCCLVAGVPLGPEVGQLGGFNVHFSALYLSLLSLIVFLQVLNFVH